MTNTAKMDHGVAASRAHARFRRRSLTLLSVAVVLAADSHVLPEAPISRTDESAVITNGDYAVTINALGVMTRVPASGLWTASGGQLHVQPGFAEWSAAHFTGPQGQLHFAAAGAVADWGDRQTVRAVAFEAHDDRAVAVTRAGDLEIRTEFSFDQDTPYLTVSTRFKNVGDSTLRDVFYSREWTEPEVAGWTFPA